ncbi:DUF7541 family protein [Halopiger xanaduensis]|uniref:Cox cluster protein n=1 Tax=Halopiger xanaduensis (strain DSM 18323 / JCM 14033 / SH-6) TaxID=797210 RepID=F8D875_HALXS|nr:hypothetical protein [Halopiger xanaduensis]AEH36578.1 cox cluster protein [Halopiger xanaduensis SH-6]
MERERESEPVPESTREPDPSRSSAWPLVAALGIVAAEAGVLFGLVVIAVAGVLAVGASVAGMLHETGYAATPWRPLRLIGAVVAIASAAVWIAVAPAATPAALADAAATDGVAVRAAVVLGAAALLILAGFAGPVVSSRGRTGGRNLEG